ncbi:MAG: hypothetical protein HZA01_15720 [Nitrospinae bacterium]|nr:hypothetical protein [Nitrospinota bacterium]
MGSLTTRKTYGLKGYMPLSHVSGDEWGLEATASSLPANLTTMAKLDGCVLAARRVEARTAEIKLLKKLLLLAFHYNAIR